jgi:hypothetical protein
LFLFLRCISLCLVREFARTNEKKEEEEEEETEEENG